MSFLDSKYNRHYGVREECNSSGNVYYDRNGNSHYDRSDAIRENERIVARDKANQKERKSDFDMAPVDNQKPKKNEKKIEVIQMTPKEQAFLSNLEARYFKISNFGNEHEFNAQEFLDGANILKMQTPLNALLELTSLKNKGFISMANWEKILTPQTNSFVENVRENALSVYEELFPYVFEGACFKHLMEQK